ncbi:MAG: hypothetical protein LAT83_16170 [Kiritimatiellae bacterium]|nr:hypothetical protein [Kiritimatiellia bacterium]
MSPAKPRYPLSGKLPALTVALLLSGSIPAHAGGRYESFLRKAAGHEAYLNPVAATFFGSESHEEFVDVGAMPDGSILAFGNAWGPEFPDQPTPHVIGQGTHRGLDPSGGGRMREDIAEPDALPRHNPDVAGMFVRYNDDLTEILSVTRFDWGLASLESGRVTPEGKLVVTGRATSAFRELAASSPHFHEHDPAQGGNTGALTFEGERVPGDVFIAQLDPETWSMDWVWIFPGYRNPPELHVDHEGNYVFSARGWWRLGAEGRPLSEIERTGGSNRLLGVSPKDGSLLAGGHNNPGTGREPWWRPYLHGFSPDGEFLWEVYGWDGGVVGHDDFRLVSDSYVRNGGFDAEGNIIVIGSSDGGNSVYQRSPIDLWRGHGGSEGYGMSVWGMQVGQATYIVRMEPENFDVEVSSRWLSYVPNNFEAAGARNRPNTIGISKFRALEAGGMIFTGRSATGLIETPNALYRYPGDGSRFGGHYVAAFNRDFTELRYSSFKPGVRIESLEKTPRGFSAVGAAFASRNNEGEIPTPLLHPVQPRFGGGYKDAWIMLLEGPQD